MDNSKENVKKPRMKSLVIDGTKYRTNLTPAFENRVSYEPADPKKLLSHIPGTITKLYVKEGQNIKEGSRIMILEAMKMKNKVVSEISGTIKKINVEEGQIVPKNFIMVEFE